MKQKQKIIACEIKEINEEERSFLAVASTEDIDRDDDRIMADGWDIKNFMKNPVVPWSHRYGEPPVAQALEVYAKDGKLMFRPKFASYDEYPFADTIFKLYKGGYLRSFSVGFNPMRYEIVEREKGRRGYDFIEQELWEVSACTVPCNPNALVEARNKGILNDAHFERISEDAAEPDILQRLDAIGVKLADLSEACGLIVDKIDFRAEGGALPLPLKSIEEKLDKLLETRTVGKQTDAKPEPETETLNKEEITEIVKQAGEMMANKVGDAVDKRIKFHLGKVE